jgi:hypothetical protein
MAQRGVLQVTVRVIIVENPLTPGNWEDIETLDVGELLIERFPSGWPSTAAIYDLEGLTDIDRVAGSIGFSQVLAGRNVTPVDEESVERLRQLPGPFLVAVGPADILTIIITIVAVVVAVGLSLLLMPKVPVPSNVYQSPNNTLSGRSNTARPNNRIPDIFGSVRSIPDLLAVPYRMFVNNLEVEIALMCVGRGSYDLTDVRDGDTLISAISGAGATFYGPNSSPNAGDPQLQIGTDIDAPVLSVQKMNEVNGQVLRAPNSNFVRGDNNIRFVAPDIIESSASDVDLSDFFSTDDEVTIGGADFGGSDTYDVTTQDARFYPDKRIEFSSFDPSTLYRAGQTLTITNGGFAGEDISGNVVYVDVSGIEVIDHVSSTTIYLV